MPRRVGTVSVVEDGGSAGVRRVGSRGQRDSRGGSLVSLVACTGGEACDSQWDGTAVELRRSGEPPVCSRWEPQGFGLRHDACRNLKSRRRSIDCVQSRRQRVQRRPGSFRLSSCGDVKWLAGGTCIFGLARFQGSFIQVGIVRGGLHHQWLYSNIYILVLQSALRWALDIFLWTLIARIFFNQRLSPANGLSGAPPSHRRHCGHRRLHHFITSILEAVSCKSCLHKPSRVLSWDARPTLACFNNSSCPAAYSRGTTLVSH
jgi:hypothetical protein